MWPGGPRLLEAMLILAMGGPILGLCLYLLNLPFMILGFAHPFFVNGCVRAWASRL